MISITKQQAFQRWDTLPDNIRGAMDSPKNSDFLWKACENEHLSREKTREVAKITGYVMMGFLHPGDMAQEIKEAADLAPQLAAIIANAVSERIFNPIRADLENIYEPPGKFEEGTPKIIEEIKRPFGGAQGEPFGQAQGGPFGRAQGEPFGGAQGKPPAVSVVEPEIVPRKPAEIDIGKIFSSIPTEPQPPKVSPADIFSSKFQEPQIKPPEKVEPSIEAGEPAPKMIHEEAVTKPLRAASGFSIEAPVSTKLSDSSVKREPPPPRPAVLEFGGSTELTTGGSTGSTAGTEPQKPEIKKPVEPFGQAQGGPFDGTQGRPPKPRVVHYYTEFRTPLEEETPPTPPQSPTPPKPESPSAELRTSPSTPSTTFGTSTLGMGHSTELGAGPVRGREGPQRAPLEVPAQAGAEIFDFLPLTGRASASNGAGSLLPPPPMSKIEPPLPPPPTPQRQRIEPPPVPPKKN